MQLRLDLLTSSSREVDLEINIPLTFGHMVTLRVNSEDLTQHNSLVCASLSEKKDSLAAAEGQRSGEAGPRCFCLNVERSSGRRS